MLVKKDEMRCRMAKNFAKFLMSFLLMLFQNVAEFTGNFDQSGTVVSACPIISAIANYENHPSVTKIRNKQASAVTFSFSFVEEKEIEKILRNLSEKEACQKSDILLRIIKKI